jgi:DNA repair protein REV1
VRVCVLPCDKLLVLSLAVVSIGIAHNILLARIATRQAKPAGSYHLLPAEVQNVLSSLDIADLHGFGSSTRQKAAEKLGASKLSELASKSKSVLCDALGKATGETLYKAIRGIDDRKLESDKPRKSVSCDITASTSVDLIFLLGSCVCTVLDQYGIRFDNNEQAEAFVFQMAAEVSRRLEDIQMHGRSVTLKIMKRDPTAPIEAPKVHDY